MKKQIIDHAKSCLKTAFEKTSSWPLVQPEVKERLLFLIEHIGVLGPHYRDAFLSLFKYNHLLREAEKKSINSTVSAIFPAMSEETYQSSLAPVRALLNLNDWIQPNDADIQACMFLCQQVDILEIVGLFKSDKGSVDSKATFNDLK